MTFNPNPPLGAAPASSSLPVVVAIPRSYIAVSTASTNAALVSGVGCVLSSLTISNTSNAAAYIKLYNKDASPTVGTDVPILTVPLGAYSTFVEGFGPYGLWLPAGAGIAVTGGIGATDTSNSPAGVQISLSYI